MGSKMVRQGTPPQNDLDRLLASMDVAVQSFAICEIKKGRRLLGTKVDAIMVHYVLAGTMHVAIPGMASIECGPGGLALIPPGVEPILSDGSDAGDDILALDHVSMARDGLLVFDAADGGPGDLRFVAGLISASMAGSFGLLDGLTTPIHEDLSDVPVVRGAYELMLREIDNPGFGTRAFTGALMKICLLIVLRRLLNRPEAQQTLMLGALTDPRLGGAVASVVEAPADDHSVASLAARAGMSRATFARHFNKAFAMNPMEFVAKTRLRQAAELLRTTKLPIQVIAASIGFASRSHFSRAFRSAYGVDPTRFRQDQIRLSVDAPRELRGSRHRFALPEEER